MFALLVLGANSLELKRSKDSDAPNSLSCLQSQLPSSSNGTLDISPCLHETGTMGLIFSSGASLRERAVNNTVLLNYVLENLHSLLAGPPRQEYRIVMRNSNPNNRFLLQGGVNAEKLENLTLQIDGMLDFGGCVPIDSANCRLKMKDYPGFSYNQSESNTVSMMKFSGMRRFHITSLSRGRILGGGEQWYGLAKVITLGDNRGNSKPIMLDMNHERSYGLEISHISFEQPAYWTTFLKASNVEIHHSNITARTIWPKVPGPLEDPLNWLETLRGHVLDFNTDGFDVHGDNVHIHDVRVENGDDCIAVKGGSNWVVERVYASGTGMTIGSEGHANNITFRDIVMDRTLRGLYIKADATNVLYENILIKEALLFPIWFGPAWQELSGGCPLLFPFLPTALTATVDKLAHAHLTSVCNPPGSRKVANVTLRNVALLKSHTTPITLFGGGDIMDVTFENFTLGDVPSGNRFPFTSAVECYNATVSPSSLTAPGQLFENCAKTEVCTEHGPKKPFVPCCDKSKWSPYGKLPSEWWGVCGAKESTSIAYV